jgi:protein-disulfide isomerase
MKRSLLLAILAVIVIAGGAFAYTALSGSGTGPLASLAQSDDHAGASSDKAADASDITGSTQAPPDVVAQADASKADGSDKAEQSELLQPGPLPDEVMGQDNAPNTVIEYASLTCPHCARFHSEVFPELKKRYIDTGKVRFIFREFPLDNYATAGFMLARCAGPGKYFPVLGAFFGQQNALLSAKDPYTWIQSFSKQIGFTQESMESCLSNQELLDKVMGVRQRAAEKFGVNSTPTFFINGTVHRGEMTIEEMEKALNPS